MSDQKDSASFLDRWSTRKQQSARRVANDGAAPEADTGSGLLEPAHSPVMLSDGLLQDELSDNEMQPTGLTPGGTAKPARESVQQIERPAPVEAATALLTDADMPDVETLTASSDISGFFNEGVSAALRKRALRHVFRQPSYNVRDGLDDYDDDYTTFEPLGDTVTSDMKFHAARKERARLESERLAQAEVRTEFELPERAEVAQESKPSRENEQAGKSVDEAFNADQDGTLEDDHERQEHSVVAAGDEAGQDADWSQEQVSDQHPDTDNPLNKTSHATSLQPCEIPNE